MEQSISIIVPVGFHPDYKKYLGECLDSIETQMKDGDEILIIDDMAHLAHSEEWRARIEQHSYWPSPWLIGCADAWNIGVSIAKNNLCLLMGSDDKLLPGCLDALREAYVSTGYLDAYYNLTIIDDKGDVHTVFNNAAAVTKGLWNLTGGFPPSAFAAPDALLISIMMVHLPHLLLQVKEKTPLYWVRTHEAQDTQRMAGAFNWETIQIRNVETARWKKPEWT